MKLIHLLRKALTLEHFSVAQLLAISGPHSGHLSKLSRMVTAGELVRVKRGLYVFGPSYQKLPPNIFALANLVYGPSYVSLESALSYYGLIPERVTTVMSVSAKSRKRFKTQLGEFFYRKIPATAFPIGVRSIRGNSGSFIIATKEKAFLDKLYLDAPLDCLEDFAHESLRIEDEYIKSLNWRSLIVFAEFYNCRKFCQAISSLAKSIQRKA